MSIFRTTAHCIYMAGASGVCSYVGVVFAVEYATNMKQAH